MQISAEESSRRETAFDEVLDSQRTFRVLLDSMSRPGRVNELPPLDYAGTPEGLNPYVLSVLKTLCDHRVSFAVAGARPRWASYLAMNSAAPHRTPEDADYVVFPGSPYDPSFAGLKRGTLEFPEASATALLCVGRILADGPAGGGCVLVLSGPGVRGRARLALQGLDCGYAQALASANAFPPLGVDLIILDAEGRVTCIPRSTQVEAG
jgi:alpha-D-ribose 1-methylphosphonate 5-triphosphate synthase subunit PhnH